jgi:hypothetical protein
VKRKCVPSWPDHARPASLHGDLGTVKRSAPAAVDDGADLQADGRFRAQQPTALPGLAKLQSRSATKTIKPDLPPRKP